MQQERDLNESCQWQLQSTTALGHVWFGSVFITLQQSQSFMLLTRSFTSPSHRCALSDLCANAAVSECGQVESTSLIPWPWSWVPVVHFEHLPQIFISEVRAASHMCKLVSYAWLLGFPKATWNLLIPSNCLVFPAGCTPEPWCSLMAHFCHKRRWVFAFVVNIAASSWQKRCVTEPVLVPAAGACTIWARTDTRGSWGQQVSQSALLPAGSYWSCAVQTSQGRKRRRGGLSHFKPSPITNGNRSQPWE